MPYELDPMTGLVRVAGGGGNATVPSDAPIQPPQAFVQAMRALVGGYSSEPTRLHMRDAGIVSANLHDFIVAFLQNGGASLDFSGNAMTRFDVNTVVKAALDSGVSIGTLEIDGGTNAAPTSEATLFGAGKIGGCASFDGATELIAPGFVDQLLGTDWTVSMWIKDDAPSRDNAGGGVHYLNAWGSGFIIGRGTGAPVGIAVVDSESGFVSVNTTFAPPSGVWFHLAARHTLSSKLIEVFTNGVLAASGNYPSTIVPNGSYQLTLGAQEDLAVPLIGNMDAVAIWSRALTNSELAALYNGGAGTETALITDGNLLAFYTLNSVTDDTTGNFNLIPIQNNAGNVQALTDAGWAVYSN